MNILIVQGYDSLGYNTYKNFDFLSEYFNVDYFYYKQTDDINEIKKRLHETIQNGNYSVIIAHSMGGFFVSDVLNKIHQKTNVILLNPYIANDTIQQKLLSYVPKWLSKYMYVPRIVQIPYYDLSYNEQFDIKRDIFTIINSELAKHVNDEIDLEKFIESYKKHNVVILYGVDDNLTFINNQNRLKLKEHTKFIEIKSKHEPFNDDLVVQNNFKKVFLMNLVQMLKK
jgi:hypothetical protein